MILSAQWFCTETGAAIRIVMLPCPVPSFTLLWAEGRPSFRKFVKRGTPGWRFNLYTLQLKANSGAPDILASRVHWCNNCRKKRNKQVKQVDYTFFRDFSKLNYLSSIRPGSSAGDPQIVDLRCLQYLPDGSVSYKINYTDQWRPLPQRRRKNKADDNTITKMYKAPMRITSTNWQHLQQMKKVLPKDYHYFYDALPHGDWLPNTGTSSVLIPRQAPLDIKGTCSAV